MDVNLPLPDRPLRKYLVHSTEHIRTGLRLYEYPYAHRLRSSSSWSLESLSQPCAALVRPAETGDWGTRKIGNPTIAQKCNTPRTHSEVHMQRTANSKQITSSPPRCWTGHSRIIVDLSLSPDIHLFMHQMSDTCLLLFEYLISCGLRPLATEYLQIRHRGDDE